MVGPSRMTLASDRPPGRQSPKAGPGSPRDPKDVASRRRRCDRPRFTRAVKSDWSGPSAQSSRDASAPGGGYLCLPTWRRAGKRFRQGRGVPPPVVYLVVGERRAGRCAGGGRSLNACAISMKSPLASAGHTCRRGVACVRSSFDISPNLFRSKTAKNQNLTRRYELC